MSEQGTETEDHFRVPSGLMTSDPANLGRWFCACGEMLPRVSTFDEALRLHLSSAPAEQDRP